MKDFPLLHKEKVKQELIIKERRQKNTANNNIDEEPLVVSMNFPALSRSLKRAKSSLPKDRAQKRAVVKAMFEDTIPVIPRKFKLLSAWSNIYLPKPKVKGRKTFLSDETKEKLDSFLSGNDISFTLPGQITKSMLGKMSMEIASTEPRNIYCGHTKNLLVFNKQKMMRSYRPLHFQLCTVMWAQNKNTLVGVRFHRLTACAQIVKMLSC